MTVLILGLITLFLAACGGSGTRGTGATVHMGPTNFTQPSVTISKGSSVTLVNDTSTVHIIANGQWVNGAPQPKQESGAPTVSNVQFNTNGQSQNIGPFQTAGTFHLYCSVHPGMNLTITVQ